jgi:hypothetical protein
MTCKALTLLPMLLLVLPPLLLLPHLLVPVPWPRAPAPHAWQGQALHEPAAAAAAAAAAQDDGCLMGTPVTSMITSHQQSTQHALHN